MVQMENIDAEEMIRQLQRGSSDVDWCEVNYNIVPGIAEFFNTISNVLFFLLPPVLIYLFRQYAKQVNSGVNIVWVLLVVVGACSAYFHATLSLVGQLLDELSIIWVIMWALAMWFPRRYYPASLNGDRNKFKGIVLCVTFVGTAMACLHPAVNHLVLITFVIPCGVLFGIELKRCGCSRVYRLGLVSVVYVIFAVTVWLSDRLNCELWTKLKFPYLHSLWHIFIFQGAYLSCVVFAYFDATAEVPEQAPTLKYWPNDSWEFFGIPYVFLKCSGTKPMYC
ncbi:alkaline ceramidase 2-like [Ptychodera flava]|uniref:alkaline ceramidase 2-like n=1 Tax=Ptychodera flava TaxID=63121 RepID=UPI00396A7FFC